MNSIKLGLIILSASTIFTTTSCNNLSTEVTEEEFNRAIAFEGVDYLQIEQISKLEMIFSGEESTTDITTKQKMSPSVCHTALITEGTVPVFNESNDHRYEEVYATEKNGTVTYITRKGETGTFGPAEEISMDDSERKNYYVTPQESSIVNTIASFKTEFKDYEYKDKSYTASVTVEISGMPTTADVILFFENKKLVGLTEHINFEYKTSDIEVKITMDLDAKLTFEKLVPVDPSQK